MSPVRLTALITALALTAACAPTNEPATRGVSEVTALDEIVIDGAAPQPQVPHYRVETVNVTVPETLKVSEANLYYPIADIVWRGEPRGDRYAQVASIFGEAANTATATMNEGMPVVVDLQVKRFHALTEKTRYSFGGTYSVSFELTVRDAATGVALDGPRMVHAGFPASGGAKALEEEARGLTQKIVITHDLTDLLHQQLLQLQGPLPPDPLRVSLRTR